MFTVAKRWAAARSGGVALLLSLAVRLSSVTGSAETGLVGINAERTTLQHVIEYAWLPVLRSKLVCKALNTAVNMHMTSLTRPRDACNQAAATIQYFFSYHRYRDVLEGREPLGDTDGWP